MTQKNQFRQALIKEIKSLKASKHTAFSQQIAKHLEDWLRTQTINHIGGFVPQQTEPNIWGIINSLGQKLALPVFNHQTNCYDWGPYKQPLVPSKFNIPEPALAFDPTPKLDACLVPAVGIDLKGNRIGWGHGYFDRLLSINIPIRMGVIFNQQIIKPPITPNNWDVPLTHILTESGIINTPK